MKAVYETTASSVGGRPGLVTVEDSPLAFQLSTPRGLGGEGKPGANPEQLFAAGYAACFGGALGAAARQAKIEIASPEVRATVGIGPNESGGFQLGVEIVVVFHDVDPAVAASLVEDAHRICPYSNATRGNIDVKVSARVV